MFGKTIRCGHSALLVGLMLTVSTPVFAQQGSAPPQVGPENGSLVIVGGALRSPEIYQRFIELAGGPDARIVMIPTAGGAEQYDQYYQGLNRWRENGARNMTVLHTTDRSLADSDDFVAPLKTADAVYFFGGRQWHN